MADRVITRGDSYALRRPLYRIELVDADGNPFDLSGCTVRTTYKPAPTAPSTDPTDQTAVIKHTIVIGSNGTPTTQNGLYLVGPASAGVLEERLTAAESLVLPVGSPLGSDIELTDANGEVFTWITEERLLVVEAYTNRTEG